MSKQEAAGICGYCRAELGPGKTCWHYPDECAGCGWPVVAERGCGRCGHGAKTTLELLAMDTGVSVDELAALRATRLSVRGMVER